MERITLHAPAKINLTLDVTGRREDGYHTLSSVMQAVDLCDRITLTKTDSPTLTLTLSDPALPTDERNTAMKASRLFKEEVGMSFGVDIDIDKIIPQQAGMAGGSADAAGVLWGLNQLCGNPLSTDDLCRLGVQVGADVPFCIVGGCALAEGIGERLTPLPSMPDLPMVVVKPAVNVSTAEAYRLMDSADLGERPDTKSMIAALKQGDERAIGQTLGNVFETALAIPEVTAIRKVMDEFDPLGSRMTGSGSAVIGLFKTQEKALMCAADMAEYGAVYLCRPCQTGPFSQEEAL